MANIFEDASDIFYNGATELSQKEISRFIALCDERFSQGKISASQKRDLKKAAYRLAEFLETGTLTWNYIHNRQKMYSVCDKFREVFDVYMQTRSTLTPGSIKRITVCCHRHFNWLEKIGITEFSQVTAETLKNYIVENLDNKYSRTSIRMMLYSLRQFYAYLVKNGFCASDHKLILSSKFPPRAKDKAST